MADVATVSPAPKMIDAATAHVARNARTYAIVSAVLVVLVLILIFTVMYYRGKYNKCQNPGGFKVRTLPGESNLRIAGNRPNWWNGSGDAGNFGSVHRDPTLYHVSHYTPDIAYKHPRRCHGRGEHLTQPGSCPAGQTWMTYPVDAYDAKSNTWTTATKSACVDGQEPQTMYPFSDDVDTGLPGVSSCPPRGASAAVIGNSWNPAASLEAAALASVGSFAGDTGDAALDYNVDRIDDSGKKLDDKTLISAMHNGESP
jgi:hypothetical protein